jgi:hypothetical protein
MDMLVHVRRGVHHVFPGVPSRWRNASFDGILTEGGFLVSGEYVEAAPGSVRVRSAVGGTFRLANPWDGNVDVRVKSKGRVTRRTTGSRVISLRLPPGATAEMVRG